MAISFDSLLEEAPASHFRDWLSGGCPSTVLFQSQMTCRSHLDKIGKRDLYIRYILICFSNNINYTENIYFSLLVSYIHEKILLSSYFDFIVYLRSIVVNHYILLHVNLFNIDKRISFLPICKEKIAFVTTKCLPLLSICLSNKFLPFKFS